MNEEWRTVPGYPAYKVSNHGQIRSYWRFRPREPYWFISDKPQRTLTPSVHSKGHLYVTLSTGGGSKDQKAVHQVVMIAFVGPCPEGLEVCHYDGNPANNHLSNLRYDTRSSNLADAKRHEAWMSKADIEAIRLRFAAKESASAIAADYDMSTTNVYAICTGISYPEYGGPVNPDRELSSLSVSDLSDMIRLRESGMGYRRIGKRFGVSESYVCYIFQGKRLADKFQQAAISAAD